MRAIPAAVVVLLICAGPALAGDGRIEISQTSVLAAGGFPFTISAPGSYVLTSDLVVSSDTSALVFAVRDVHLDLNGFAIRGSSSCTPSACTTGSASAISYTPGPAGGGDGATVRDGTLSGFSFACVVLRSARLERLDVSSCGGYGLSVNNRSAVLGNRVSFVGQGGIGMGDVTVVYANNTVTQVNLSSTFPSITYTAVDRGTATGGNFCDDGSCSGSPVRRRYYLTQQSFLGNAALTACATGFHMAEFGEISDTSHLAYETKLGITKGDSGNGPPTQSGWIRTGRDADVSAVGGLGNCLAWTTDSLSAYGSFAAIYLDATGSSWQVDAAQCGPLGAPVWCVED